MNDKSVARHTPGPWTIHPMHSSRTGLDAGRNFDYPWHVVPASHADRSIGGSVDKDYDRATYAAQICTFNDFGRFEREEIQANARLIAAAPDLYKAVNLLLPVVKAWLADAKQADPHGWQSLDDDVATAEAAMRKAKGEL